MNDEQARRASALRAILAAAENRVQVVEAIAASGDTDEAIRNIEELLTVSSADARVVLDLQLRGLTRERVARYAEQLMELSE